MPATIFFSLFPGRNPLNIEFLLLVIFALLALTTALLYLLARQRRRRQLSEATGEVRKREIELLQDRLEDAERRETELRTLMQKRERERDEKALAREQAWRKELLATREENARLRERMTQITQERAELRRESAMVFRQTAQLVLEERAAAFRKENEAGLLEILLPFRENIDNLKKQIDTYYADEARHMGALQENIKNLAALNNTIEREAKELTEALRGNSKMQGDWGEMILEHILAQSGLRENEHYFRQACKDAQGIPIESESGRQLRPDILFYLPDGKNIVIDSKVSLSAYVRYCNATGEEQEKELKSHVASLRAHVNELSAKSYQRFIENSADFVIMFIPNEAAYLAGMNGDPHLWLYAQERHVTILSPAHLIATLRLIRQLWSQDAQNRNTQNVIGKVGGLYDKLAAFVEDLQDIGKNLEKARSAYDNAFGKLSEGKGNVLTRMEAIKKLGNLSTKKRLPRLDKEDETPE